MDNQLKIGIDFSLISPAVCIQYPNNRLEFISFFDDYGKDWKNSKSKKFQYHQELSKVIDMFPYTRLISSENYREEQSTKMKSAKMISDLILNVLKEKVGTSSPIIGIEGFSYGSISSSTLDLAMFNSFLRLSLINNFGDNCIQIISPTEGKKKLSDKGNADKNLMIESFISNRLNDEILIQNPFWNYCKSNNLDYKNIKPIDDLVDSYAILKSI